jgi:hypothetical protein
MMAEQQAESIENRIPSVQNAVYRGDEGSTHDMVDLFAQYLKVMAGQNSFSGIIMFSAEEMEYMSDLALDLLDLYREWEKAQQ